MFQTILSYIPRTDQYNVRYGLERLQYYVSCHSYTRPHEHRLEVYRKVVREMQEHPCDTDRIRQLCNDISPGLDQVDVIQRMVESNCRINPPNSL